MTRRLRLGIIGVGQIARQSHIPAALAADAVELTALVDSLPSRAEMAARQFGIKPTIAPDVEKVLDNIDAAIVATPNDTHCPLAVKCLEAGKSVLIEKPLANSSAKGERIIEAAEKHGAVLAVGYCSRFRNNVLLLKELLDCGTFGTVRRFVHQAGTAGGWAPMSGYNLDRVRTGGGVLVVTGSHFLDRMLYFWGYPDEVEFRDDSEGGPEANCTAKFRFARAGGSIEGFAIYSKTVFLPPVLIVETERGRVFLGDFDESEIVFRADGQDGMEQVYRRSGQINAQQDVFKLQLEDLAHAHQERRPPLVDGRQGLDSVRLIEQLYTCRQALPSDWYL